MRVAFNAIMVLGVVTFALLFGVVDVGAQEQSARAEVNEKEEPDALFGSWNGIKNDLEESGVSLDLVVTGDFFALTSGGLSRDISSTFLYQAVAGIDTQAAGMWSNGTFHVSGLGLTGQPFYEKVGDFQYSNNIDGYGMDTLQLYEAWYEHAFYDGDLTLLVGLHDYNSEFYVLDYAFPFIQSSFGIGPDVSQVGNSIFPVTTLAGRVRVQPTENSYFQAAVYDGIPGNPNNYGRTSIQLKKSDGLFYAAEIGLTSKEEDSVIDYFKVAVGGWYQTTDFTDYGDRDRSDNGGGYIIGERKVYSEAVDPVQGLGIFGQFGVAPGSRNFIARYMGAGLNYTGLLPDRDEDLTLFGVASAQHGNQYLDQVEGSVRAETAIELSYRFRVASGIALQPDFQYILNPGLTTDIRHAVVVGTRLDVAF